jgi:septal ring factor EnvC (AmiA/AmiB activator)
MKNVVLKNSCLVLLALVAFSNSFAQSKSEQLQAEQKKLEKKLSSTKSLLDKVKKNANSSMNELKLIDNQVKSREALVQNIDNQVRGSELSLQSKGNQVKELGTRINKLKARYKKMMLYAYKHRNKYGKMMYIFSSHNYFEAIKRNNYLKKIAEIQHKQYKLIQQNKKSLSKEMNEIAELKKSQEVLLQTKLKERDLVLQDKQKKEQTLAKLKKDEGKLIAELKAAEKQKAEIQRKIKKAIDAEIAAAAAKEKKAKETASTSSSSKAKTTTSGSSSTKTTEKTPEKKVVTVTETKESAALGKSFEANKGKLPWPVLKGALVEAYGKNPHPTLSGVFTNNNGIDIGAPKNSQVRAVFEGEVTSVISIPGAGKCVIIKHGNYRTVYSNLQEVYVSVGAKISTKQSIGSLLSDSDSNLSTVHFEIHQVVDGAAVKMNPSLWLTQ